MESNTVHIATGTRPTAHTSTSPTAAAVNPPNDAPPPYTPADLPPVYMRDDPCIAILQTQQDQQRSAPTQLNSANNNTYILSYTPTATTANNTTRSTTRGTARILASYTRISTPGRVSARTLENAQLRAFIKRRDYKQTVVYLVSGFVIMVSIPLVVWYLLHVGTLGARRVVETQGMGVEFEVRIE